MRGIDPPGPTRVVDVLCPYMSTLVLLRVLSRCQAPKGKRPESRVWDPVVGETEMVKSDSKSDKRARGRVRVSEWAASG